MVRTEMAKAEADLWLEGALFAVVRCSQDSSGQGLKLDQQSVVQQELLRTAKADEDSYLLFRKKAREARIADALDQSKIVNVAVAEAASSSVGSDRASAGNEADSSGCNSRAG